MGERADLAFGGVIGIEDTEMSVSLAIKFATCLVDTEEYNLNLNRHTICMSYNSD